MDENITPAPETEDGANQTLYVWSAPLRPYKKRSGALLRFFLAVALIVSAIVFFFGDLMTIIPIWALLALFYIFAVTPPPIVENRLTWFGIESAGVSIRWDALSHFYFTERLGFTILVLVSHGPYHAHSYYVVPNVEVQKAIRAVLEGHLMFLNNPPVSTYDKVIGLMSKLLPEDPVKESVVGG